MQGGMLMPEVSYHAGTDTVTVDVSAITADPTAPAQLTPLLVSHPTNRFAAADPWFDCLDPSRQGLAFSRRYGFTPAKSTDALPVNRQLWIRKLSGSSGLGFYDYRKNPKRWIPLFGTAGTTNAAYWNGMMWHVGVTAPPGTNTYEATFDVFVVDVETGVEITNSGSGPFVLHWTDVPDGRPALDLVAQPDGQFRLAWPESATNWLPVCSATLAGATWSDITNEPVLVSGMQTLVLDRPEPALFFQMRLKP